jgi:hypothetical protein
MKTGTLQVGRKLSKSLVVECSKTLEFKLKLDSVESRMVDNRECASDLFISTLRQCTVDRDKVKTTDLNAKDIQTIEEEEADQEGPVGAEDEDIQLCAHNDAVNEEGMSESDKTVSKTKGFNVNCSSK